MSIEIGFTVCLEDGKYEYVPYADGSQEVLRHGEPWKTITECAGDKFLAASMDEIERLSHDLSLPVEPDEFDK